MDSDPTDIDSRDDDTIDEPGDESTADPIDEGRDRHTILSRPAPEPVPAETTTADQIRVLHDDLREATGPRPIFRFWLIGALVVTAFLIVQWLLGTLSDLLIWLLIALFISFALEPAVTYMAKRGMRRGPATFVAFVCLLLLIGLFLGVFVPMFLDQLRNLITTAIADDGYVDRVVAFVNERFGTDYEVSTLLDDLEDAGADLKGFAANLAGNLLGIGAAVVGWIFSGLTIALFTFYMVADGPRMRRTLLSAFRPSLQRDVLWAWETAIEKTGGYIYSRGILAIISALFHTVAFMIIGLPSPFALGLWVGVVSQFVPTIGTYLAGALPVVIAFLDSPWKAVAVVLVVVAYQQIENYIVSPRITRNTMSLHPAVAFGSVIAGGMILGATGAILALPAAAIIQAFFETYSERHEVVVESELTKEADANIRAREKAEASQQRKDERRRRKKDEAGDDAGDDA